MFSNMINDLNLILLSTINKKNRLIIIYTDNLFCYCLNDISIIYLGKHDIWVHMTFMTHNT